MGELSNGLESWDSSLRFAGTRAGQVTEVDKAGNSIDLRDVIAIAVDHAGVQIGGQPAADLLEPDHALQGRR